MNPESEFGFSPGTRRDMVFRIESREAISVVASNAKAEAGFDLIKSTGQATVSVGQRD